MPFLHRHLVNTPNSGKGCSTGAQNSARVCLYAEHEQAKPRTSEWLWSPSRTSVPSIGQNTDSPAKCLLLWSPKCSLAYLMNRETKAQDIFVHSHHLPIHLQSGSLSNSISSVETQALQILLLAPRMNKPLWWYSVTHCLTSPLGYFDTCFSLRNLGFKNSQS